MRRPACLDVYALHSTVPQLLAKHSRGRSILWACRREEVLATGKPVVARETDIDRYPNPNFRRFVELGFKSICSVPLIARNRIIGTLALNRMTNDDAWSPEDVEFLVQVANQIAMTVENSLLFGSWQK